MTEDRSFGDIGTLLGNIGLLLLQLSTSSEAVVNAVKASPTTAAAGVSSTRAPSKNPFP